MKKVFLVLLLFNLITSAYSQRHLKGQKGVFFMGGISQRGYFGKLGSTFTLSKKLYINFDFMYEGGKVVTYKFDTYNFSGTLFLSPFKPLAKKVYFNAGLGLTGNRASIRKAEVREDGTITNISSIDFGPLVALEVETFVSSKIAWIVQADQRFFLTNNFAKVKKDKMVTAFYAGTGFRFLF